MQNNGLASIATDVHHCHVMHTPTCPKCGNAIAPDNINVGRDVAFCKACDYTTSLSAITRDLAHDPNVDLANPPPGAWYRDNGTEKLIGASGRSFKSAIGLMILTVVWNGIITIFVLFVLAATFRNIDSPMPGWMPGPVARSGSDISGVMNICMWLFLAPFILIGTILPFSVLMVVAGHTEVRIAESRGTVFRGIGFFGRKTHFNPADVRAVRIAEKRLHGSMRHRHDRDTYSKYIAIDVENADPISFGDFLTEKRMNFMVSALNAALNLDRKKV